MIATTERVHLVPAQYQSHHSFINRPKFDGRRGRDRALHSRAARAPAHGPLVGLRVYAKHVIERCEPETERPAGGNGGAVGENVRSAVILVFHVRIQARLGAGVAGVALRATLAPGEGPGYHCCDDLGFRRSDGRAVPYVNPHHFHHGRYGVLCPSLRCGPGRRGGKGVVDENPASGGRRPPGYARTARSAASSLPGPSMITCPPVRRESRYICAYCSEAMVDSKFVTTPSSAVAVVAASKSSFRPALFIAALRRGATDARFYVSTAKFSSCKG